VQRVDASTTGSDQSGSLPAQQAGAAPTLRPALLESLRTCMRACGRAPLRAVCSPHPWALCRCG
jgi:hypothetical protein